MTPLNTALTTLLKQFGLTTADKELVPRLTQAGHRDALQCCWKWSQPKRDASAGLTGYAGPCVCRPARRSRRSIGVGCRPRSCNS